ncbi:hypothetical protein BHE74_00049205 [Ensete ventricosum]|nr:hypothetical protein GW17_00012967 [Ensete ventricosum]RWW44999.1 hypothetical protein BHE74_00049205 [Ensete ventricosum]RZR99118.1 hypothetical protein BHM03_00028602 [Ensete ventricosum]
MVKEGATGPTWRALRGGVGARSTTNGGVKTGEPGSNGERTDGVCVRMRAGARRRKKEKARKNHQAWNFELIHGKEQWTHFQPAASSHSGGGGDAAGWMVADGVTLAT